MVKELSPDFINLMTTIARLQQHISRARSDTKEQWPPFFKQDLHALQNLINDIGLPTPSIFIGELIEGVGSTHGMSRNDVLIAIDRVNSSIRAEMQSCLLIALNPNMATYYKQLEPFGAIVAEKFPSAIDDIEGAAKCLALGQSTATVLHLMRIMEVGLKSLSGALDIPYAPSWESHLKQINGRIAAKHKKKGTKWKRDERLFRDLAGDLQIVKIAWRNPTMHVGRKYGEDEAEQIFKAVRTFMERLATRFGE